MGHPIWDMATQVVDGEEVDKLWMNVNGFLIRLPLPSGTFNPTNDSKYRYYHESHLVTGWFAYGFLDIEKLFTSLKLIIRT